MPPSDCGVIHQIAEFVIEYANFRLFSERFFTYPIPSSFPSQSLALADTQYIFNELQARGDKQKLMQFVRPLETLYTFCATIHY